MSRLSSRAWFFIGFLVCTALILIALYLQYFVNLEPCPLCMLQRVCFIALGIVFLIGALHGPGKVGTRVYAVVSLIPGLTGMGLAIRHTYLQYNPPEYVSCAGDFYSQLEAHAPGPADQQCAARHRGLQQGGLDPAQAVDR